MYKGLRNRVQPVAVKLLRDSGDDVTRSLEREMRALRLVSKNVNVVQLFGVVLGDGAPAMILELCEVLTLHLFTVVVVVVGVVGVVVTTITVISIILLI